jgi:hypothetical protein
MKIDVKRLIKDEKGQTLILALILLIIGGLIIAPLLSYMNTGLTTGGVYERKADELYAADAGVEDAVLKIQHQVPEVQELYCGAGNHTWSYNISDVNDKKVDVILAYVDSFTYRVVSTATGDGSGTKIDAYITGVGGNYSGILDNVLTSQSEIDTKNADVNPPSGEHGPAPYYEGPWPTPEELADWYGEDIEGLTSYASDTIDLAGVNMTKGPLYTYGTLTIKNSDKDKTPTLALNGTFYITGDASIGYGTSQNRPMTLDLNGQTIFVESSTADALKIGDMCTVMGPGVIIAVGDIYFKPKAQAGGAVFILSVSGTTQVQPQGDFYGAIAGNITVDLQPNTSLDYPEEGWYEDFNFPLGSVKGLVYSIASWEVSGL